MDPAHQDLSVASHSRETPILRWRSDAILSFYSDYTRGQGMDGGVENRAMRDAANSNPPLARDGTVYRFQIPVAFDGASGFESLS